MEDEILSQKLREAAWNVLHENPGIGFEEWKRILLEEYPSEVVDVLGTNQKRVMEPYYPTGGKQKKILIR